MEIEPKLAGSSTTFVVDQDELRNREILSVLEEKKEPIKSSVLRSYLEAQKELKEKLKIKKDEWTDDIEPIIRAELSELQREITSRHDNVRQIWNDSSSIRKEVNAIKIKRPDVILKISQVALMEKGLSYFKVCQLVEGICDQIEVNLKSKNDKESESVFLFHKLFLLYWDYISKSSCTNFKDYTKAALCHWKVILLDKLTVNFEALLEEFGWPMKILTATPSVEAEEKFHKTIKNLIIVSSCASKLDGDENEIKHPILINFPATFLPVKILVKPLKKRFRYNFFTDKATNDPSKPEWYFTQVKAWLRDLVPFIKQYIEPISLSVANVSCVVHFARCCVEMLVVKVDSQVNHDTSPPIELAAFAKILEESVAFESDLFKDYLGDLDLDVDVSIPPLVSSVFSQPRSLDIWIKVEREACLEKLDEIFSSPTKWKRPVFPGPAEIVDLFIAILRCVTDRFAHLQQPGHKLQFLKLLLDLIDDFRIRCLQTWRSGINDDDVTSEDVLVDYVLADSLTYIQSTIESWEDLPFFSSLSFFLTSMEAKERESAKQYNSAIISQIFATTPTKEIAGVDNPSKGLFYSACYLLECLGNEILTQWCNRVIEYLKEFVVNGYAKLKWHLPKDEELVGVETDLLTFELLPVVQTLEEIIRAVGMGMRAPLAEKWMKRLATRFDEMMVDSVILTNKFSKDTIPQLRYDIRSGVFSIFEDCQVEPTVFLSGLNSSLRLLEMNVGSARLLYETLTNPASSFATKETTLAEMDVNLRPGYVLNILRSRGDVS